MSPNEDEWEGKWCTETLECEYCGHRIDATYPIICERVECTECGQWIPTDEIAEGDLNT